MKMYILIEIINYFYRYKVCVLFSIFKIIVCGTLIYLYPMTLDSANKGAAYTLFIFLAFILLFISDYVMLEGMIIENENLKDKLQTKKQKAHAKRILNRQYKPKHRKKVESQNVRLL